MRILGVFALVATLVVTPQAKADELKASWGLDGALLSVGLAGTLIPELAKDSFAPDACHWCHRQPDGSVSVNGFDRAGRNVMVSLFGVTPPTWARTTDVMAFGALPLASLVTDFIVSYDARFKSGLATDTVIVAESVFLAAAFNQLVKFTAARQRPFVAYDSPFATGLRHGTETVADDNLSFYSGHSSAALATTTAMARIIQLRTGRLIGYALLVPLGIVTSLLRMSADKHWATDVITGMVVGAAVGFVVPTLHRE